MKTKGRRCAGPPGPPGPRRSSPRFRLYSPAGLLRYFRPLPPALPPLSALPAVPPRRSSPEFPAASAGPSAGKAGAPLLRASGPPKRGPKLSVPPRSGTYFIRTGRASDLYEEGFFTFSFVATALYYKIVKIARLFCLFWEKFFLRGHFFLSSKSKKRPRGGKSCSADGIVPYVLFFCAQRVPAKVLLRSATTALEGSVSLYLETAMRFFSSS